MSRDLQIIKQLEKELGIQINKVDELPEHIDTHLYQTDNNQNVISLSIYDLYKTKINFDHIVQLQHLTRLHLVLITINHLPPLIEKLQNLRNLDLGFTKLKSLPPEIGQLRQLEELNLRYNSIHTLPSEFSNLHRLTTLNLSKNRLQNLPPEIGQLRQLEELNLVKNPMVNLPSGFSELQNLNSLFLQETHFNRIPPQLLNLQNLRTLDLRKINWSLSVAEIITSLIDLKNLDELYLTGFDLTDLPSAMTKIKHLRTFHLDLSGNKWTRLPPEIVDLHQVTELNLAGNQLGDLPVEIINLPQLKDLSLGEVGIGGNQIRALSPEIAKLTTLTHLDLSGNKLTSLPSEIAKLQKLEMLWLATNNFKEFPSIVLQLKNLKHLGLPSNGLMVLPDEISKLVKLESLSLYDNRLKNIPSSVGRLRKLKFLELEDNPLEEPPPEIVKQPYRAVIEYLRQLLAETSELNQAKMILVGQGDVGKTCLAKRLIFDTFQTEKSTEGIDILNWELAAPTADQQPIKLNVWDFGGQEIYHATHQFFLTKRSVYLLVWNARKSKDYEHIYYWLHTIEAFGGDSPIILVMTKLNERDDDLNMKDLRDKFPQIIGLYKVDSEDGRGIPTLIEAIREIAWGLPHMRTTWIDAWINVRRRLEQNDRPWIEHHEFQQICAVEGLDKKQTDILDEYFHDLGIIIHFRHNVHLWNMVILKPEWATSAIYQVLDTQAVRDREGVLLHQELDTIWDKTLYPRALFPNLLELMNEFELAYELPDKKSRLVAELLPSTEPDFPWSHTNNLHFYYYYDFLPAGVITRFIVLVHPYLELRIKGSHLCWREGCVLHWEKTRAIVRVRKVEKLIEIRIDGQKKRELLAIIRHQFDYINRSIKNINIIQQIPCNCSVDCTYKFNYEQLLQAEIKGRHTVDCQDSWLAIPLPRLLDGYERREERVESLVKRQYREWPTIQVRDKATLVLGHQEKIDLSKRVEHMTKQEKVIKIGKGASVSAPVIIADTIENSFNTLMESDVEDNLKQLLDHLLRAVTEVNKNVSEDQAEEAEEMVRDSEALINEATSSKPRRHWYEFSVASLKQAAINIGKVADPVLAIVKKLTPLLLP